MRFASAAPVGAVVKQLLSVQGTYTSDARKRVRALDSLHASLGNQIRKISQNIGA